MSAFEIMCKIRNNPLNKVALLIIFEEICAFFSKMVLAGCTRRDFVFEIMRKNRNRLCKKRLTSKILCLSVNHR